MLKILNRNLRRLYSRLRWPLRRHSKPKIIIRRFGQQNHKPQPNVKANEHLKLLPDASKQIRIATFNAAMFSMAPAVPEGKKSVIVFDYKEEEEGRGYLNSKTPRGVEIDLRSKSATDRPKSILKQSPSYSYSMSSSIEGTLSKQQRVGNSKLRVSINLPDNQISLERRTRRLNFTEDDKAGPSNTGRDLKGKAPMRSSWSFPNYKANHRDSESFRTKRTILEVLKEVDADILALQDVKADEAKGMKPLSDLANALGMKYVFAESWAPEYGNAILSKWPIKRWKIQKIYDDTDFRNVLKATVDVPQAGEVNFHCTQLDHLDEDWRMKQITAIIQSEDVPNILAGGLNSLDQTDYSQERMMDIVKYYEEIGKPTPKVEVMKFLKEKNYVDAKLFAGECEAVVMIAKGQGTNACPVNCLGPLVEVCYGLVISPVWLKLDGDEVAHNCSCRVDRLLLSIVNMIIDVQGTCKYGTRVDYILSSPDSPYKFVPGSYAVISSKGTSDHHIVKVDITVAKATENAAAYQRRSKKKVVKITNPSSRGIWTTRSRSEL